MSVAVIGTSGEGGRKAVIASLAGLPLSSLLLGLLPTQAVAAEPPAPAAVEAPRAEAPVSEAPPVDAPPAEPPLATPPAEPPPVEPPATEPVPAESAPIEPAPAELAPLEDFEDEPPPVPRDSIFAVGHGTRGDVTVAIGGVVDAVDPRAAAGAALRVPQFTSDARFGLGKGWSLGAHLSTIIGINELDVGVSYAFPLLGDLRALVQFQAGAFVGMLGSFGFESLLVAPQFRPLVGVTLPTGSLHWSLRGEIIFSGPYSATIGEITSTLATPPPVANWNVGLLVENLMRNDRLWYAGLVLMASTGMYQNWLLFPDTSRYDYYPRVMGGYEF